MADELTVQGGGLTARPTTASVAEVGQVAARKPESSETPPRDEQQRVNDPEALEAAVRKINDYVQTVHRELNFSIDESVGRTVIKVINAKDNELIRQIPAEEVLAVAKHLKEMTSEGSAARGLLVKVEV